jgi:adenylate kinase family enzyme
MNAFVLGFASRMGSGRRELSKRVATALALPRVSFGEYIRAEASRRGLSQSREVLQEIGESLVRDDCNGFCRAVLNQADWKPGESLVVDGIRHKQVEEILEEMVKPSLLLTVFLDVDDRLRFTRLPTADLFIVNGEEETFRQSEIERVDAHSTEAQVKRLLPSTADLVVKGGEPTDTLISKLELWVRELRDASDFLDRSSSEDLDRRVAELAESSEHSAIDDLRSLLLILGERRGDKRYDPGLVCRALVHKGPKGVEVLASVVREAPGMIYPATILESLWYAAQGASLLLTDSRAPDPTNVLNDELPPETVVAAQMAFQDLITECRMNEVLFQKLLHFLYQGNSNAANHGQPHLDRFRRSIFETFAESSIKITRRVVDDFEHLVEKNLLEQPYQEYLTEHSVIIDPLAAQVIDRQRLGLELTTDFVVRRLDNEYVLVEIEKPRDSIFTSKNDFTAEFTHAFGQVIGFQAWVDEHSEYARHLMPGISCPRGLLVIGRRKDLTTEQSAKLRQYCLNSQSVTILTYDDLVERARTLYANIYIRESAFHDQKL